MSDKKKQFIGRKEILSVSPLQKQTPQGGEILNVVYHGGSSETMPKKTFDIVVSDTAIDDTELRNKRSAPIILDILNVLMEYDVKLDDANNLLNSIGNEIENVFQRATSYLWTKDDSQFIPGVDPIVGRTFLEAIFVTQNISKDDKKEARKN